MIRLVGNKLGPWLGPNEEGYLLGYLVMLKLSMYVRSPESGVRNPGPWLWSWHGRGHGFGDFDT